MDIQNMKPTVQFRITRVGMRGIKKPIHVERNGKVHILSAEIDLFVDLPHTQKGSHMSRNAEVIAEVVDKSVRHPCKSIEGIAQEIAGKLLERHEYASQSEVLIHADYFMDRKTPMGNPTLEPYNIFAHAVTNRDGRYRKAIGIKAIGMTACPCAMETVRHLARKDGWSIPDNMPYITHNQRNIVEIEIEGSDFSVDAENLIDIAEASVSSPTYEILKREGEGMVVLNAHKKPKFVEDVVRSALKNILATYPKLPDDIVIRVKSESEESIHKHTAFAERVATISELRKMN